MKKFLLILVVMSMALISACSSSLPVYTLAWVNEFNSYERSVYSVTVFSGDNDHSSENAEQLILAEGTLELVADRLESGAYYLQSTYSIRYKDSEQAQLHDLDLVSYSEFNSTLTPIKSHKTAVYADNSRSYSLSVNYGEQTEVEYTDYTNQKTTRSQKASKTGAAFDNESLYFVVRGIKQLDFTYGASFDLFVGFDFVQNQGRSQPYPMALKVGNSPSEVTIPESIYLSKIGTPEEADNYSVPCYATTVRIDAIRSGPSIILHYSSKPFIFSQIADPSKDIQKALLRIEEFTYDHDTSEIATHTVYNLQEYSLIKQNT